jgi:hypothetical protein
MWAEVPSGSKQYIPIRPVDKELGVDHSHPNRMNRELGSALARAMTCHYNRRHRVATEFIAVAIDLDALRIDRPLLAGPAESQLGHQGSELDR